MRRYVEGVIRYRLLVIGLTVLISAALASQISQLRVIIDPNIMLPQDHPFVAATNQVERLFGSKYIIVIGITPKQGDAFSPHVLGKVQRLTTALLATPGVIKENVLSLAARRAKSIVGTPEGIEVRPLMETIPQTPAAVAALRQAVRANPVYLNTIISGDERTAAILVEFREGKDGFRGMVEKVRTLIEQERDSSVDIALGGPPVFLDRVEAYSQRIVPLFALAVLITGLIHYEAFRTVQGLILPLITALLAVISGRINPCTVRKAS